MKDIYLISGLAADERVFQNLDFPGFKTIFLPWLLPEGHETIEHYAKRMAEKITGEKPILLGLSFGGMMALEIAKTIQVEKTILISSIKYGSQLPPLGKLLGNSGLLLWIPGQWMKQVNFVTNWLFGAKSPGERALLRSLVNDADPRLLKWSLLQTVNWKNKTIVDNVVHIHGEEDHIFPSRFLQANYVLKGAGHFMILNRGREVSEILQKILGQD